MAHASDTRASSFALRAALIRAALLVPALLTTTLLSTTAHAADVRLSGGGATFPQPLYERWVSAYQKLKPTVKIDYQGIGSGGGIKAITDKTVAFAGSDAPLAKKELDALGGNAAVLQVPSCAGGVVPTYNVPGLTTELRFTAPVLADIFLGTITKWNDPKLTALNPGVKLPDLAITPAWRTDGSGTTFVFTSYLAGASETFKGTIGMGKQVRWPVGQGGKGNPGVAAVVQQTPGAIGYVEHNFANANKLAYGAVRNRDGQFVKASPASISAAGDNAAATMSGQVLAANIWDQPGATAYPIASFTYLITYVDLRSVKTSEEASALADFLWWSLHDGQKQAAALDYTPLSPAVLKKAEEALTQLRFQDKPLLVNAKRG